MARRGSSGRNFLLGIRKPRGCSSHDVVNRLRRILGERRVGHAGTLDPLASGVMVLGVGQATRLLGLITTDVKSYRARIVFGRQTTTDDAEGSTLVEKPAPGHALDPDFAAASMQLLRAMKSQIPPQFSAISVNGVRAYAAARAGDSIELKPRPIEVYGAECVGVGELDSSDGSASQTQQDVPVHTGVPYWDVDLTVSKGCYVRSLARDLGQALGSAAYVGALERRSSGGVNLDACADTDTLEQLVQAGQDLPLLDPVKVLGYASCQLKAEALDSLLNGKTLAVPQALLDIPAQGQSPVCLVHAGRLWALAARRGSYLQPKTVFPQGIEGVSTISNNRE